MRQLQDGFGRQFNYLRLSVTEACNFRCTYCLPNGYRKRAPHDFLQAGEVARLVRAFRCAGVNKVRLTGGEPSARKDLAELIGAVAATGVEKVALTTNGWALDRCAAAWAEAGLTHLNVSADSLEPAAFARITGFARLDSVLLGVERALKAGLSVKLNAVLLHETAEAGFRAYADYVRERPVSARFIELMRTGDNAAFFAEQHLPGAVLQDWLKAEGWTPAPRAGDGGPAQDYVHRDYRGRIGLIAPYAPGFCDSCNRLRVTARGSMRLCLFGEGGVDLRDLLQRDCDFEALVARIEAALSGKARGHRLHSSDPGDIRQLAEVGG